MWVKGRVLGATPFPQEIPDSPAVIFHAGCVSESGADFKEQVAVSQPHLWLEREPTCLESTGVTREAVGEGGLGAASRSPASGRAGGSVLCALRGSVQPAAASLPCSPHTGWCHRGLALRPAHSSQAPSAGSTLTRDTCPVSSHSPLPLSHTAYPKSGVAGSSWLGFC